MGSEGNCSPSMDEDKEWKKVALMRAFVEEKDPQAKVCVLLPFFWMVFLLAFFFQF